MRCGRDDCIDCGDGECTSDSRVLGRWYGSAAIGSISLYIDGEGLDGSCSAGGGGACIHGCSGVCMHDGDISAGSDGGGMSLGGGVSCGGGVPFSGGLTHGCCGRLTKPHSPCCSEGMHTVAGRVVLCCTKSCDTPHRSVQHGGFTSRSAAHDPRLCCSAMRSTVACTATRSRRARTALCKHAAAVEA